MKDNQTIAQFLNVKDFPFEIKDKNNNLIYYEDLYAFWQKQEFDSTNNKLYYESSFGSWEKREYDSNNALIYYEDSTAYWEKRQYDSNKKRTYFENSNGLIIDDRPKELTMQEIADKFGIKVEDFKIKK